MKKYLPYIISAIVVVASLALIQSFMKDKERLHEELIGTKQDYKQLSEHSANLERQYVNEKQLREEAEKKFKQELQAVTGRLKMLSNATFLIREKARESNNSDLVYKGDKIKYVVNEIRFNDGPAVGYVLIFDDGRVVSKMYNHQIDVSTLVARDEKSGKYDVLSKADYILKSPSINFNGEKNWVNKPYPLKITGGKAVVDPTEPINLQKRFYWFSPRYNANLVLDSEVRPGLAVSIMGYGLSKRDLDFKVLQIGATYLNDEFSANLTPVLFRPFKEMLPNTYLGPGIDTDKRLNLNLSIGF